MSSKTPVSLADSYELPSEFSKPEPGWTLAGGTSASSPLIAGTMALASAYTRSLPGAEALYLEAAQNGTGVLDDVTSGSNGSCGSYLCDAGPGYDGPTGLGSPYGAPVVLPNSPTAATGTASSVTQTTATLNASVNPNGATVSKCEFEYGTTSSYGSVASCSSLPGSGSSPVAVSAPLTGLIANTTYHFRISATNAGATSKGSDETFKTTATPMPSPMVETNAASSVTQTSAALNATVDPNAGTVVQCEFEYGTTPAYGSSVPCTVPAGATGATTVTASIEGLDAATTYYFRVVAANQGGTSTGLEETHTTLLPTTLPQQGPGDQQVPPSLVVAPGLAVLPSQEHATAPLPDARLASTSLAVSMSGAVGVGVRCPTGESSCAGTIVLQTLSAVSIDTSGHQSKKPKASILTLARGSFSVAGGRVKTVTLHLSGRARTLLARSRLLRVRAMIVAHAPAGASHTTETVVTLRPSRAARH